MDDYGEEEYYQKKIAEMDAIERAQEREFEKQIAEYNAKNPIKKMIKHVL